MKYASWIIQLLKKAMVYSVLVIFFKLFWILHFDKQYAINNSITILLSPQFKRIMSLSIFYRIPWISAWNSLLIPPFSIALIVFCISQCTFVQFAESMYGWGAICTLSRVFHSPPPTPLRNPDPTMESILKAKLSLIVAESTLFSLNIQNRISLRQNILNHILV